MPAQSDQEQVDQRDQRGAHAGGDQEILATLAGGSTGSLTAGTAEYVGVSLPLRPSSDPGPALTAGADAAALVLQSPTERLRFLRTVNTALAVAAFAAVLLATVLSYGVARTVTRPLGTITDTMREVATTGDLTRKITLRGPAPFQDEDARLLANTFNTLTDSIARFQREATQKDRLLSLGRLSTVIAHEVRNPLMIIKAALRSLRPGRAPRRDPRSGARHRRRSGTAESHRQ